MEFLDAFDPNNLIKSGLKSLGVPAFLIFLLAAWWFITAWIEQVKKLTATGQKVGKSLKSAALHVGSYRPRTLLGRIPLTAAVGGLQLFLVVVLYLFATFLSLEPTGRMAEWGWIEEEEPERLDSVREFALFLLAPNWITLLYLVVMGAMLYLAYRREPRGWRLWLAAGAFGGPATLVTVPLAICSPCLVPYAWFQAEQDMSSWESIGDSPEQARAFWWDQNGWWVAVIGVCAVLVLLSWVALRLATPLKECWLAPDTPRVIPGAPPRRSRQKRRAREAEGPRVYDPESGEWS
jgi:type IV secretory pathway VirB3-like protein